MPWLKILVKGNHDKRKDNQYIKKWFIEVLDKLELLFLGKELILTHEPIKIEKHFYNIHWRLHLNHRDKGFIDILSERHFLYSCEKENYKPILLEQLLLRKNNNKFLK